jgi:hypothetical protein
MVVWDMTISSRCWVDQIRLRLLLVHE